MEQPILRELLKYLLMKQGKIIESSKLWYMDTIDEDGNVSWDYRFSLGEIFAVCSAPFRLSKSYYSVIVLGPYGLELLSVCCVNKISFLQQVEKNFREVTDE